MKLLKIVFCLFFYLSAELMVKAQTFDQIYTNFQPASFVIGQSNLTGASPTINQVVCNTPTGGSISANGVLAIADLLANRVLLWNQLPVSNGTPADIVLGKLDFMDTMAGTTSNLTSACQSTAFSSDGSKLLVVDRGNRRVLIWNSIPLSNGAPADVVIGQIDFDTSTTGTSTIKFFLPTHVLVTPDDQVIVTDRSNHRVLIYNNIPNTNSAPADVVIGQVNMNSALTGNTANQMNAPLSTALSPDGKLLVLDGSNHRVLIFNSIPTTNNAAADIVIGQTDFGFSVMGTTETNLNFPIGVAVSSSGQIAVGDGGNNRILIYDNIPTNNNASANVVFGQSNFVTSTGIPGHTAQSTGSPGIPFFDSVNRLFAPVSRRVLVFGQLPPAPTIISETMVTGKVAVAFNYSIQAAPTNVPTAFGATNLPVWASLAGNVISGNPTVTGLTLITLFATNQGGVGITNLTIVITNNPAIPPGGTDTNSIGTTDFNGDGFPDVLMQKKEKVTVLTGSSNGVYKSAGSISLPAKNNKVVAAQHVNGTNYVALKAKAVTQIRTYTTNFAEITASTPNKLPKDTGSKVLASGDVNGDGSLDLVTTKGKKVNVVFGPGYSAFATINGVGNSSKLPGKVVGIYVTGTNNVLVFQKGKNPVTLATLTSSSNAVNAVTSTGFNPTGKILGFSGANPIYLKKGIVTAGNLSYTNKPTANNLGKVVGPK